MNWWQKAQPIDQDMAELDFIENIINSECEWHAGFPDYPDCEMCLAHEDAAADREIDRRREERW